MCVNISVPDGIYPGDEFLVELSDGFAFYVLAPEGVGPGEMLTVEVPVDENACMDEQRCAGRGCGEGFGGSRRVSREVPLLPTGGAGVGMGDEERLDDTSPRDVISSNFEPKASHAPRSGKKGLLRSPSAARMQSPPPTLQPQPRVGKYLQDQLVEVERNDGSWSRATVQEHEAFGDTYTVRLADRTGRIKYFVEADELRPIRCGCFVAGRRVLIGRGSECASVDDFDEETSTYTVRLPDGRMRMYILEEEMREV